MATTHVLMVISVRVTLLRGLFRWPGGGGREREAEVKGQTEACSLFSYSRGSGNLILNPEKSIEFILIRDPGSIRLECSRDYFAHPNLCRTAFHTHFPLEHTFLLPATVLEIGCFGCPLDPPGLQFPRSDMQNKITHLTSFSWYLSENRSGHAGRIQHCSRLETLLFKSCWPRVGNTGAFRDRRMAGEVSGLTKKLILYLYPRMLLKEQQ